VQGKISDFSIPDIFQLVSSQQKSGALTISGDDRVLVFLFLDGRIVDVEPRQGRPTSEMLGGMLVDAGILTPLEMKRMLALQEKTAKKLGELLVEQGKISRENLARYLYLQVKENLYFALRIKEGEYRFEGFAVRSPAWASSIRPDVLMMEGMQFLDEYQIYRDKLPPGKFQIVRRKGATADASLAEEERRVWEAIDFSTDPWRVFRRASMTWFEGIKALCGLNDRELVRVSPVAEECTVIRGARGELARRKVIGIRGELARRKVIGITRAVLWTAAAAAAAAWVYGTLLSPQAVRIFSGWTAFFE
jgi:hypothetical protein